MAKTDIIIHDEKDNVGVVVIDKILDAIGDLYLLGHGLMGSFSAYKSGHHLNNLLLRELVNNIDAWEEVTIDNNDKSPIFYSTPEPAIVE